ncbi:MAG: Hsp20/alpha crystallin family protein [Planctomycetia bacterium]|nr:Hsp20/alpha crystallin family protein [Planctomycetia bacterium]
MANSTATPEPTYETPAEKLRDVLAGWIDTVAAQGEKAIDTLGLRGACKPWVPQVDVVEGPERVVVQVDLPGVGPDQVEIVLVGNMLTIKGEQPCCAEASTHTVHRRERPAGSFSRSIPLPVAVNAEHVSAESKNGVLTITLGKEERSKPRHIPIGVRPASS